MDKAKFNNTDFQNRKGSYPQSGIPTEVCCNWEKDGHDVIELTFKNTSERKALEWSINWLQRFDKAVYAKLDEELSGAAQAPYSDYEDDWVEVYLMIKQ